MRDIVSRNRLFRFHFATAIRERKVQTNTRVRIDF